MRADPVSVLHVVPSINPNTGGPAVSVPGLAGAQARAGARITVASLNYAEFGAPAEVPGVRYLYSPSSSLGSRLRGWSPALSELIEEAASESDVVHSHALWMVPGIYARRAAERFGSPLIISPRGMLDAWSKGRSRFKKAVAAFLYERRNLNGATLAWRCLRSSGMSALRGRFAPGAVPPFPWRKSGWLRSIGGPCWGGGYSSTAGRLPS